MCKLLRQLSNINKTPTKAIAIKFIVFDLTCATGLAEVPIIYYLIIVQWWGKYSDPKNTPKAMSFNFVTLSVYTGGTFGLLSVSFHTGL